MIKICKCCKAGYIKERPLDKYIKDKDYKENCFSCYEKITGKTYGQIRKEIEFKLRMEAIKKIKE